MSTKSKAVRPRKQSIVVELGTNWVKLARFEAAGGKPALTRLHVERFDTFTSDVPRRVAAAAKDLKVAGLPVTASLSRQMVNIRMLDLPSVESSEIADMVDLQAGKQTPYSKDEILCAHRIIGSARPGYTRVMLVIVQRSLLRQQYALLDEAGIRVERMTVASEGLINWFAAAGGRVGDEPRVLLDVDAAYTDVSIFSRAGLVFTRSIMVGGDALRENAEGARERLGREIHRSLDMFEATGTGQASPARVVLTGARVAEGLASLGDDLEIELRSVNSLKPLAAKPSPPDLGTDEFGVYSVTALAGIALNPDRLVFNLVPDVVRMRRDLSMRSRRLTAFVALVLTAMMSASLFASVKFFLRRNRLDRMREAIDTTQPVVERTERMRELIKVARGRMDTRFAPLHILSEIHGVVGGDLYFEAIDIDRTGRRVSLSGSSGTAREIQALVRDLMESDLFQTVRETGTRTKDARTGRYEFEVVCELEE